MEALQTVSDAFFSKDFWLAEHLTWDDFKNKPDDDIYIAQPRDLYIILPIALLLFVARSFFESFVATPIGRYAGISEKTVKATPNVTLENAYKINPYPTHKAIEALGKQLDLSEKQIQRWLRRRRNQARPTVMTKFTETAWRCFFYLVIFIYGLHTVSQKSWFRDVKDCWREYPRQHVSNDIYWYYMVELGFYLSLLFSQFADVKRKDFWEHFVHHLATISLMCFSWSVNFVRVGTLILCLHDAADWFLEGAKLARYCNLRTLCDVLFGIFTVNWLITRLMIYPYVILWTTWVDSGSIAGFSQSLYVFNALLWVLQILHVFWFFMIMSVAVKALTSGTVDKDVRSASEESCDDTTTSNSVESITKEQKPANGNHSSKND